VLHCCHTVVTLLSHCCYTVVTLLSHCCYTALTLLLHSSYLQLVYGEQHPLNGVNHEAVGGLVENPSTLCVCVCVCVCVCMSVCVCLCVYVCEHGVTYLEHTVEVSHSARVFSPGSAGR
jgi:hypothetical protein